MPLVYMIVHKSPGAGGDAGAGAAAPASRNAAHVCVVMPASLHAWERPAAPGASAMTSSARGLWAPARLSSLS